MVAAALTWTETQTFCDPRSVPHPGLHQDKDGTNVNKGREWLVPGCVWGSRRQGEIKEASVALLIARSSLGTS